MPSPAPLPSESVCHVLREDPDLSEAVPEAVRARALEHCVAPITDLPTGPWQMDLTDVIGSGIGLLVLRGLLLRRVGVEGRFGAELLGQGDLLRPWQGEHADWTIHRTTGWQVLAPTRLAILDEAAAYRLAAYPQLTGRLVARALERSRHLSVSMAIVHHARVTERVHMMLWHLADRWGRVRSEGVLLPLGLTHTVLADLVAARRPTVTTALSELYRRDAARPVPGGWLLLGDPPGELLVVQQAGASGA